MSVKGNRKRGIVIAGVCVAAAAAVVLTGGMPGGRGGMSGGVAGGARSGAAAQDDAAAGVVVDVITPSIGNLYVSGQFAGTVEAGQTVTIYPKVSGEVTAVNFTVGETVQAGDVLCTLDSTTQQLTVTQQQAAYTKAKALAELSLEKAQNTVDNYETRMEEGLNSTLLNAESAVATAKSGVESANATLVQARKNYRDARDNDSEDASLSSLRDKVTDAEYKLESAQLALEKAEASLEATKRDLEELTVTNRQGLTQAEINANVTNEYITLQKAQNELNNYTIKAPIGGVIEQRGAELYNTVNAQSAVFVITNKDAMKVSFYVAEAALASMSAGDEIIVEKGGQTCTGIISEIGTMVSGSTGLFPVTAVVEHAPFALYSGSTVKISANTKKAEGALLVPVDAVYYESGAPLVYVYENGTAVKRYVEVGISDNVNIVIESGLSVRDQVISTWSSRLADGAEVSLLGEEPAEPAGDAQPAQAGSPQGANNENAPARGGAAAVSGTSAPAASSAESAGQTGSDGEVDD